MSALGDFLERRRNELNITSRRQLALKCDLSHSVINDICNGLPTNKLTVETLQKLSYGTKSSYTLIAALAAPDAKHEISVEAMQLGEFANTIPKERLGLAITLLHGLSSEK